MDEIIEILKFTIPAVVVLLAAYLVLRIFMKNEEKKRKFELAMSRKDSVLPIRLQAYERLILFLERISPESLVMRMNRPDVKTVDMQNELITTIRTEFEHNLSQQTYISSIAWDAIKNARTNMIKLINESASELKPDSSSIHLSRRILEKAMELPKSPVFEAIEILKKEVRDLF